MSQENVQNNQAELDALSAAMLMGTGTVEVVVKAEDLPLEGGGINFKDHFFEPQIGSSYLIKFLPNLENPQAPIVHRKAYKALPDPQRKGKTFHFVSSGSAKTCKALDGFFTLNNAAKAGDALAKKKIDEFMTQTNQGCCMIQVLNSPVAEEIGIIRMFAFSTFGPNATVANLINAKLNPTAEQIKNDFEKEDIFNAFESSVMLLECTEASYGEDNRKGRDFTKSAWAPKKRGAFVKLGEVTHQFTKADIGPDGKVKPEVVPFFMELVKNLKNPDYSIHNYFGYKPLGHELNTEDTEKYLKSVHEKVDEIMPIILNATSIAEIKNYGKAEAAPTTGKADGAKTIGGESKADILKNSAPTELQSSVMADVASEIGATRATATATETPVSTSAAPTADDIAAIAGS